MSLRIGFDVDGVLADFRTAFRDAAVRCLRREVDDFVRVGRHDPTS